MTRSITMEHITRFIGQSNVAQLLDLPDEARHERAQVWASTFNWWNQAHQENTAYHQNFRGYCPNCVSERGTSQ